MWWSGGWDEGTKEAAAANNNKQPACDETEAGERCGRTSSFAGADSTHGKVLGGAAVLLRFKFWAMPRCGCGAFPSERPGPLQFPSAPPMLGTRGRVSGC